MSTPQILVTETGEELIVLTRRAYEALLARAGAPPPSAAPRPPSPEITVPVDLPENVRAEIADGVPPMRAIRFWRRLTQMGLANKTGLTHAAIRALEDGTAQASAAELAAIARALEVAVDNLTPAGLET